MTANKLAFPINQIQSNGYFLIVSITLCHFCTNKLLPKKICEICVVCEINLIGKSISIQKKTLSLSALVARIFFKKKICEICVVCEIKTQLNQMASKPCPVNDKILVEKTKSKSNPRAFRYETTKQKASYRFLSRLVATKFILKKIQETNTFLSQNTYLYT